MQCAWCCGKKVKYEQRDSGIHTKRELSLDKYT